MNKLGQCYLTFYPSPALHNGCSAASMVLDKGNTTWIMVAGMFVMLMCIPGLAMFYGGFIRSKNVLSVFAQMLSSTGFIGVLWGGYGYSLAVDTTGMMEGKYNFIALLVRSIKSF